MTGLEPFLDRDVIALDEVAAALRQTDEHFADGLDLESLVVLGTRLPSGLVHAEGVWIQADAPAGVEPLARGSDWYAIDQSVAVVLPPIRSRLATLLLDLARYHAIAERVSAEIGPRGDLVAALLAPNLTAATVNELALLLDAPPGLVAALDEVSPGLRADLAAMASRTFEPLVRLHAALRAGTQRRRGRRLAEDLLTRLPDGPFRVVLSDGPLVVEHLSPYVRDLGHALATWALENPDALTVDGLADALSSTPRGNVDLAALVVPDLLMAAPDLVGERREAEATAGLDLRDEDGGLAGWAELSRLAAPDEQSISGDVAGTVVVLAGAGEEVLVEALRVWLDSGRVVGVASILATALDVDRPVVADAVVTAADGMRLPSAPELVDRAARLGIEVLRPGVVPADDARAAPRVLMDVLGLVRRAKALGRVPEDGVVLGVLYAGLRPVSQLTLDARLSELLAGRLALGVLLSSREDAPNLGRARRGVSQNASAPSRRFRA